MLEIKNITKDYVTGDEVVHALRDVSISFRENELVSILGHSGCGKTTLLNIIGGLDQYTSGDLIINGKSTTKYKSSDWDTYRNHSVGFIFQSYNLIPHQSVLSNVELALTLSGVSKAERRQRAVEALEKVGLGDQINKKPNQMSGGQMQRVAIARALVNDPDILLADEPTGALDTETSFQIMELIKEIAKDRLVIMVTHNPELAELYSTRIVRLVDGKITADSDPFDGNAPKEKKSEVKKGKKTSMSFGTALSLSLNNLMTKKGRTFLTSFAGSIGIIGIALILSLSNGVQAYIDSVEHSTLASYPISIQQETIDYTSLMTSMMGIAEDAQTERDPDLIYTNDISTEMVKSMLSEIQTNNLAEFKEYIEGNPDGVLDHISEIKYSYSPKLYIYGNDINGDLLQVNPSTVMTAMMGDDMASNVGSMADSYSSLMGGSSGSPYDVWTELLGTDTLKEQYEVVAGKLPESYNEVVLIVNERNELSDITLYALGLRDQDELGGMMDAIMVGESFDIETGNLTFTHDELLGLSFRLFTSPDFYEKNDDGVWVDKRSDEEYMTKKMATLPEIKVVGIIRPCGDSLLSSTGQSGGIGYTHALTEFMIDSVNKSDIVIQQKDEPLVDVFTGVEFPVDDPDATALEKITEYISELSEEEAAMMLTQLGGYMGTDATVPAEPAAPEQSAPEMQIPDEIMSMLTPDELMALQTMTEDEQTMFLMGKMAELGMLPSQDGTAAPEVPVMSSKDILLQAIGSAPESQLEMMLKYLPSTDATYDGNLETLGVAELSDPSEIKIYAKDFESKEFITDFINKYNERKTAEEKQEDIINYTDYVGLMISSVSDIIDSISYILIAFVAISLVVSSIMIGIITYISVLERTKEIGILRAIGASKRDISRVFNAETLIVGFAAGAIGIIVTLVLIIPINIIIEALTDIANMAALPWVGAVVLVVISMVLTLIAGVFPSRIAAKKDPVEALRSE
ncbi:MAG: ABC transporter ATP-binding protein/permease [Oscillospiraceae bacterium]|nr:ABC transporter ATP-binding protein/permease [Oscillospiraceae bacterium]